MILTDREIKLEIEEGNIRFEPDIDPGQIGNASVDVRLGSKLRIPVDDPNIGVRPTGQKRPDLVGEERDIPLGGYNLRPKEFVVGKTLEKITLPNYLVGRLEGKSTLARFGLLIHVTSAHIDPGFRGVIILELCDLGVKTIVVEPMMLIAHIVFHRVSTPPSKSYSGQYADQIGP